MSILSPSFSWWSVDDDNDYVDDNDYDDDDGDEMIKMVLFFVLIIFVGQYIIVFICQMMAMVVPDDAPP